MATTFKNYLTANVGTVATTVVTGGANQTSVYSLSLANVVSPAANITASVTMTSGAATVYLCKDIPIPNGSAALVVGAPQKVSLENGDIIQVIASVAGAVDVLVSTVELN
jgi:hypothetical protein